MGWWSDYPTDEPASRWYIATKLCLIHSEIDEAAGDGMDSHLQHRTALEVELADTVIRTFDLIGFLCPDWDRDVRIISRPAFHFHAADLNELLMRLHLLVSDSMEMMRKGNPVVAINLLFKLVATVEISQSNFCLDVYTAMLEKLEYNAKRADHQLVNRQAAGGKAY